MSDTPSPVYTDTTAAEYLGISVRTLRRHVHREELVGRQIGFGEHKCHRRYSQAQLDAFLASQSVMPPLTLYRPLKAI